jgi:hypothetical protein
LEDEFLRNRKEEKNRNLSGKKWTKRKCLEFSFNIQKAFNIAQEMPSGKDHACSQIVGLLYQLK